MSIDPLDSLLSHFRVSANLIHSGPLCGDTPAVLTEGAGHLHVVTRGRADVRHDDLPALYIVEPTLLFYPRPIAHRFLTDKTCGADFLCATIAFRAGHLNPIVKALPPLVAVPLSAVPDMRATLDLLFSEAAADRYGRRAAVGRLFEVVLTQLLRKILTDSLISHGMLAGVAHPQLGKSLVALHDAPGEPWTLEKLAEIAGMSRSRFAQEFKSTVGTTLGEYLAGWRVAVAQELLRDATPLKQVASRVGYGSPLALTRAFRTRLGVSPREWLQAETAQPREMRDSRRTAA